MLLPFFDLRKIVKKKQGILFIAGDKPLSYYFLITIFNGYLAFLKALFEEYILNNA